MIARQVQSNFPPNVVLPRPIYVLCNYLDTYGYPISGCFEVNTRGDDAESWFPGDSSMQDQIAVFGNSSTGSTYALWLSQTKNANEAPVVMLGAEGEFKALATSSAEFCRLLGCGYDELEWDDLSAPPKCWAETKRLRDWIQQHLQITSPKTGHEIAAAASGYTTPFAEWVTKWQNANL